MYVDDIIKSTPSIIIKQFSLIPRIPVVLLNTSNSSPNDAVTLQSRPQSQLPDPIPSLNLALGLQISQLIPDAAARRVPEPLQRLPRSLHVLVRQVQVLLYLVQRLPARGEYADVVERQLVVGYVGLGGGASLED